jgi:hypothetical protein
MKRLIVLCAAALLILPACGEDESSSAPSGEFDTNLVGFWYRLDEGARSSWTGTLYHNAFYISPDATYHDAGVETGTGKIALLQQSLWLRIQFAHNGRIGIDWFMPPGGEWDTLDYRVDWNVLTVSGSSPISGVWVRKQHSEKVTDALDVRFTLQIDGVETSIPGIAPDAGAAMHQSDGYPFCMRATFAYGYRPRALSITVLKFNGPGTYTFGPNEAWYTILDHDLITDYHTDSLYTGSITIDTYDTQTMRCSGSFDITMRRYRDRNNPPELRRFSNGRFSVPIFP